MAAPELQPERPSWYWPTELVEALLAALPLHARAAARLVCRHWAAVAARAALWPELLRPRLASGRSSAYYEARFTAQCGRDGGLLAAQWLAATLALPAADPACGRAGLLAACRTGRLDAAQWLGATFPGLTWVDGLRAACAGGFLEVAVWVAAHFGLATSD